MGYEDFDNKHRKQKIMIILWGSVVITLLIALIVMLEGKKTYYIYKTAPSFSEKFVARDVCYAGFNSIAHKSASDAYVTENYIRGLVIDKYSKVNFKISDDSYRFVEMESDNICKIILKDDQTGGHGLRSFKIKLIKNSDYIFNYKVASISEVLLVNDDLKRRNR